MSSVKITIPDPAIIQERQRLEDERSYLGSVTRLLYQHSEQTITLQMKSGVVIAIPLRLIDELANAPGFVLENALELSTGGDALSVRSLDVDIAISGLLRDILGLNFQRLGGLAKSEAKAAAARANGKKGGRPKATPENFAPQEIRDERLISENGRISFTEQQIDVS